MKEHPYLVQSPVGCCPNHVSSVVPVETPTPVLTGFPELCVRALVI